MPTRSEMITNYISFDDQLFVDRLRKWLNDTVELNVLEEVQESSDEELHHALQDTLDEINYEFSPSSNYKTFGQVPSWNLLKLGATLQVLTSKGIMSSRNTITYRDGGGVTVQDMDKYGWYIIYFNILITKYSRGVMNMKRSANIDAAYGGVGSEYGTDYWETIK